MRVKKVVESSPIILTKGENQLEASVLTDLF
jgi:hypothetical protein